MANLIQDLGSNYFNEFMPHALFSFEGKGYRVHTAVGDGVACYLMKGTTSKPSEEMVVLPFSAFDEGMSSLKHPPLGYRAAMDGQVLMYLNRTFSTRRGLQVRDISVSFHDVALQCARVRGIDLDYFQGSDVKSHLVFDTNFTPFLEGFNAIKKGDIASFAVSPDFAVAPSDTVEYLEIMFRQRRVGTVSENGRVSFIVPTLKPAWESAYAVAA